MKLKTKKDCDINILLLTMLIRCDGYLIIKSLPALYLL